MHSALFQMPFNEVWLTRPETFLVFDVPLTLLRKMKEPVVKSITKISFIKIISIIRYSSTSGCHAKHRFKTTQSSLIQRTLTHKHFTQQPGQNKGSETEPTRPNLYYL